MSTATIIAVVAVCIAALNAAWTAFWSIYTHRRTTLARVTVTSSFAIPVYGDNNMLGQAAVDITATNTGSVPISVSGVQLRIQGKGETLAPVRWVVQTPRPLPLVLQPGEHWMGMVSAREIVTGLAARYGARREWKVRGFVRDPAGKTYEGREWIEIDIGAVEVLERP